MGNKEDCARYYARHPKRKQASNKRWQRNNREHYNRWQRIAAREKRIKAKAFDEIRTEDGYQRNDEVFGGVVRDIIEDAASQLEKARED